MDGTFLVNKTVPPKEFYSLEALLYLAIMSLLRN